MCVKLLLNVLPGVESLQPKKYYQNFFKNDLHTGEFMKRVREISSQLFATLYTLDIYPSAHKQLRRHLPNPFR